MIVEGCRTILNLARGGGEEIGDVSKIVKDCRTFSNLSLGGKGGDRGLCRRWSKVVERFRAMVEHFRTKSGDRRR